MVRNLTRTDSFWVGVIGEEFILLLARSIKSLDSVLKFYNYYRKCPATNPEYEIDFYARLNLAQVARLDNSRNVRTVRKQFEKLLADTKNQEFKDKIYYELGEFERKQGNVPEAIEEYKRSAHAGKNKRIQGSAFYGLDNCTLILLKVHAGKSLL